MSASQLSPAVSGADLTSEAGLGFVRMWTGNHQAELGEQGGDSVLTQCPSPGQAPHGAGGTVPTTCSH